MLDEYTDYIFDANDTIAGFFHTIMNVVKDRVHR